MVSEITLNPKPSYTLNPKPSYTKFFDKSPGAGQLPVAPPSRRASAACKDLTVDDIKPALP